MTSVDRPPSSLPWRCRRELLRVLNRGEAVNALKRAIYVGRVASYQAKQHEEMQAVADALGLSANWVMAWNTMKMQSVLDRWNTRRSTAVPPGLIGRIAPTRTQGINLRGVFTWKGHCIQQVTGPPAFFPAFSRPKYRHFWHGNQGNPT